MVSGYQNTNVIDIVSKGISKGTGVKAIKKHFLNTHKPQVSEN